MSERHTKDTAATDRLAPPEGERLDLAGCTLAVRAGPDRGLKKTVEGRSVRIGTGPDCDLKLTDSAVSRSHVLISLAPDGFAIEDLGSTNGTRVNGVVVPSARTAGKCEIQIGQTLIDFSPVSRKLLAGPAPGDHLEGLLGSSMAMRRVYGLIRQVAPTEATVVITGETGTGKELAARAIHALSPRRAGPFEVLDCGNIDRELLGSELFGHRKGAFTGAASDHRGAFDRAQGGTVFLDEIGELPADVQSRLLGVLQRREVRPLGAESAHPIDARVIAATHRDLDAAVAQGRFRGDLYFRLAVIRLEMPPLAERLEDLPELVAHFLARFTSPGATPPAVTAEAMASLRAYPWKGNIRELANAVERAVVLSGGQPIAPEHLIQQLPAAPAASRSALEEAECRTIRESLARNGGNRTRTARELGIGLATLKRKIRDYGLDAPP